MAGPAPIDQVRADVAILGGGICGLWTLAHLRAQGYAALLCESGELGMGQTLRAQGIIHGGLKYALDGALGAASQALTAMPARWRASLQGERAPDLRGARLLSPRQYLVAGQGWGSRLAGLFASKLLQGRVAALDAEQIPEPLAAALGPPARHAVYQLEEPVVDVPSVLQALAHANQEALLAINPEATRLRYAAGHVAGVDVQGPSGQRLEVLCEQVVLCAGAGNEALGRLMPTGAAPMQRRPLRMVMLRGALPHLYAHWLGAGTTPRVTVTSHRDSAGRAVWYLGGALAEAGVDREPLAHARAARDALATLLPGVDLSACALAVLDVERAEGRQAAGLRPDGPVLHHADGVTQLWPTKLAFAPLAAEQVAAQLAQRGVRPGHQPLPDTRRWPRPAVGVPPWDEVTAWH
ncbi:FAD-dependent oxidoreductase [Myxococcus sp. AM001]|nr:FAD-dependent oxidoreductase [Myxococcus sp. AM001]